MTTAGTGLRTPRRPVRVKISATVDPKLLEAVDAFVEKHGHTDRSKVLDEALRLWYAREQERAMEEQFGAPVSELEQAERAEWRRMRNQSTLRRLGRRR